MKVVTLQTKDFKGLKNGLFTFKDNNLLTGRNGSGKSSIAEAIIFGLYGRTRAGNTSTSDLIHENAESTKVALQFDTGTTILREESRLYGTKIELNGKLSDQTTLEASLPDYKTFLSIFLIGYFSSLDESDQRSLFLSYSKGLNLEKLFKEYTRKPELLERFKIDFNNLDKEYKQFRKIVAQLKDTIIISESRIQYAGEQIKSLKKPKAKVDVAKLQAKLDKTIKIREYQEILEHNSSIAEQSGKVAKGVCPECGSKLSESVIADRIKNLEKQKKELPEKPTGKPGNEEELRQKLNEADTINALYDNYEEQILGLEKQKSDSEDQLRKSKQGLVDIEIIVEAISPKGIRADAAREQIAPIQKLINEFTGKELPVKIETLHQQKNGNMKEVFRLYGNEIPYKFLSTGEKKRVDIAISQTINKLSDENIDTFFLDDAELISGEVNLSGQVFKAYVSNEDLTIKEG